MTPVLSCFIVDDEPYAIEALKEHVLNTPSLKLVGTSTDPFEALVYLQKNDVALIFLDINMGKMSGMEFTKFVDNKIIWTTAHEKYALKSFDYENTVDYLMKPIMHDRFQLAVKKALHSYMADNADNIVRVNESASGWLQVRTSQGETNIAYSLVDYIKANRNSSTIFYGKERAIVYKPLKDIESTIPADQFIRIHKSYIVNRTKIKSVRFDKAILYDNRTIPKGRTYKIPKDKEE